MLDPDALPFYRRAAACAGCAGITGAYGPTAFPQQLRTPAEPGYGLYLPREEVFSRSIPTVLLILCPISLAKYLNSSDY